MPKVKIGVVMSSNLMKLDQGIRELVDSNIEYNYFNWWYKPGHIQRYRVRGNFGEVLDHLKAILEYRRSEGSRTPVIEWQYVVMKHNEFQMGRLASWLKKPCWCTSFHSCRSALWCQSRERQELVEHGCLITLFTGSWNWNRSRIIY
jgi:hypothetical protein